MSLFKSREKKEQQKLNEQMEAEAKRKEVEAKEKQRKELWEKAQNYVFTVSASDYARSKGKDLSGYDLRCVYAEEYRNEDALTQITRRGMAIGAEAIVDVRSSHDTGYSSSSLFLIGTALILRKQN